MQQQHLFLPHRLYAACPQSLSMHDNPAPNRGPGSGSQLPFATPLGLNDERAEFAQSLRYIPLVAHPLHTQRDQKPTVASTVEEMTGGQIMGSISHSPRMLSKLRAYADETFALQGHHDARTTWDCIAEGVPLPSSHQQAKAVYALAHWYAAHYNRGATVLVNSEPAVQDQVYSQLIRPLDLLIKTRYADRSHSIAVDAPLEWEKLDGTVTADRKAPVDVFLPQWLRAVHAAHPLGKEQGKSAAGFTDYMVYTQAPKESYGAMIEIKFFISTSDAVLEGIISPTTIDELGNFRWDNKDALPVRLVKQLWGQIYYFKGHWGAITNGRKFRLYMKTVDDENGDQGLTFSDTISWDHPNLYPILAGMTFASIDCAVAPRLLDRIKASICPLGDQENRWRADAQRRGLLQRGGAHPPVPPLVQPRYRPIAPAPAGYVRPDDMHLPGAQHRQQAQPNPRGAGQAAGHVAHAAQNFQNLHIGNVNPLQGGPPPAERVNYQAPPHAQYPAAQPLYPQAQDLPAQPHYQAQLRANNPNPQQPQYQAHQYQQQPQQHQAQGQYYAPVPLQNPAGHPPQQAPHRGQEEQPRRNRAGERPGRR